MGIGAGSVWTDEEGDPYSGGRDDQAASPTRRPPRPAACAAGRGRRACRPGRGQANRDVGGERGQLGAVRAASAWPARTSSSSLVTRPCTNASFSASITCSRSAWAALSRSPPAAAGYSGPVITGAPLAR